MPNYGDLLTQCQYDPTMVPAGATLQRVGCAATAPQHHTALLVLVLLTSCFYIDIFLVNF